MLPLMLAVCVAMTLPTWKPRAWQPPRCPSALQSGLRVAIDPVDGALSMPLDDGLAAHTDLELERAPLRTILHSDGSVQVVLDDRYLEYAVVRRGEGGRPAWTCVQGPAGLLQFMHGSASALVAPLAPLVQWEEW